MKIQSATMALYKWFTAEQTVFLKLFYLHGAGRASWPLYVWQVEQRFGNNCYTDPNFWMLVCVSSDDMVIVDPQNWDALIALLVEKHIFSEKEADRIRAWADETNMLLNLAGSL